MSYQSNNSRRYPSSNDRYIERVNQKERDRQFFEDKAVYDANQRRLDEIQQKKIMREQQQAEERQRAAEAEQQRRLIREQQYADEQRIAAQKKLEEETNKMRLETNRMLQDENDRREEERRRLDELADDQRREQERIHQNELQAAEDAHFQSMIYKQNAKSYRQYNDNSKNPYYFDDDGTIISAEAAEDKWQQYACPTYHEFSYDSKWRYYKDDNGGILSQKNALHKYYHSLDEEMKKIFCNYYKSRKLFKSNNHLVIERNSECTKAVHDSFTVIFMDCQFRKIAEKLLEPTNNSLQKKKELIADKIYSDDWHSFDKKWFPMKSGKELENEIKFRKEIIISNYESKIKDLERDRDEKVQSLEGKYNESLSILIGLSGLFLFLAFLFWGLGSLGSVINGSWGRIMKTFFGGFYSLFLKKPLHLFPYVYIAIRIPIAIYRYKTKKKYEGVKRKYDADIQKQKSKMSQFQDEIEKLTKSYKTTSEKLNKAKEIIDTNIEQIHNAYGLEVIWDYKVIWDYTRNFYWLFYKQFFVDKNGETIKKAKDFLNEKYTPVCQHIIFWEAQKHRTIKVELPTSVTNRFVIIDILKYYYDILDPKYTKNVFDTNTDIYEYYNKYLAPYDYFYILIPDKMQSSCTKRLDKYGIKYKVLKGIGVINEENFELGENLNELPKEFKTLIYETLG